MKHAGQKSVKEELPEQRKGPKRAVECRLKVQTHVWEQDAGSSSLPTRTNAHRSDPPVGAAFLYNRIGPPKHRAREVCPSFYREMVAHLLAACYNVPEL